MGWKRGLGGVVGWKKRGKRLLWVEGKTAGGVERCGGNLRELTGGGQWGFCRAERGVRERKGGLCLGKKG